MRNLFVYGMLLFEDEEPTHGINAKKYIKKSEPAQTRGKLYVVEGFPFLVPEKEGRVKGKLFTCQDIDTLLSKYDVIEGANQPNPFFERKVIEVELEDGSTEEAYCYVGGKSLQTCFAKTEYLVESGDWLEASF